VNIAILAKLILAMFGVAALQRSFSAYRSRRRDQSSPPDPVSDWAWRLLGIGASIFLVSVLAIQLISEMPKPLLSVLFLVTAAGVAIAFVGCFLIGWRSLT